MKKSNKVGWVTDIHVNFLCAKDVTSFCKLINSYNFDKLIITGDISEGHRIDKDLKILQVGIECPIYFVLGNHDYYRSSVSDVREKCKDLNYLPNLGVVELFPSTALIGIDGWNDAHYGDYKSGRLHMSDWDLIQDIKHLKDLDLIKLKYQELLQADLPLFITNLSKALNTYNNVIIATHIPPWPEACWHQQEQSDKDWLPWFTCRGVGEAIESTSGNHWRSTQEVVVLTGHTHGSGVSRINSNITVFTKSAEYSEIMNPSVITENSKGYISIS